MTDFLLDLAGLSLGGAAVIVLLLLLGRLTRGRYSARWRCWAWALLCLRLAIPLSLPALPQLQAPIQVPAPADTVLYAYQPPAEAAPPSAPTGTEGSAAPLPTQGGWESPAPAPSPPGEAGTPAPEEGGFTLSLGQVLFALWLAGAVGVLGWNLIAHLRFCRWRRRWTSPEEDPEVLSEYRALTNGLRRPPALRAAGQLGAPMLTGLARPVILLPDPPPRGDALRYALLHELTHLRRRDIWLKALALWVTALHWFDPLMWVMARAVERDTELACDEAVVRALPPEERGAYGRAILDTVAALSRKREDGEDGKERLI